MAFGDDKTARKFQPPVWFGSEVTSDTSYRLRAIALTGRPAVPEVEISNAALASLLDALDHREREAEPTPPRRAQAPTSEAPFDAEADQELDELTIEDSVIRDLAPIVAAAGALTLSGTPLPLSDRLKIGVIASTASPPWKVMASGGGACSSTVRAGHSYRSGWGFKSLQAHQY